MGNNKWVWGNLVAADLVRCVIWSSAVYSTNFRPRACKNKVQKIIPIFHKKVSLILILILLIISTPTVLLEYLYMSQQLLEIIVLIG